MLLAWYVLLENLPRALPTLWGPLGNKSVKSVKTALLVLMCHVVPQESGDCYKSPLSYVPDLTPAEWESCRHA